MENIQVTERFLLKLKKIWEKSKDPNKLSVLMDIDDALDKLDLKLKREEEVYE